MRGPLALWLAGGTLAVLAAAAIAATVDVSVEDSKFVPAELTVKVGTTVRWTNRERRTSHSVIWEGGVESERFFPGESYSRTFDKPGRYPYSCGPHPEMKGLVTVTE